MSKTSGQLKIEGNFVSLRKSKKPEPAATVRNLEKGAGIPTIGNEARVLSL